MTQPLQAPPVQLPRMSPAMAIFALGMVFVIGSLGFIAFDALSSMATLIFTHTDLPARIHARKDEVLALLIACGNDKLCAPWLWPAFTSRFSPWLLLALIMPPALGIFVAVRSRRDQAVEKDPGAARWESVKNLQDLLPRNNDDLNPQVGYLGQLRERKGQDFDLKTMPMLLVPVEQWAQNTLVKGGVGSGKTTGFFANNVMLAAHFGMTVIVFDVKWPQRDSGFFETLGYWHLRGRRVKLLTPFEPTSLRMPLMDDVVTFDQQLRLADTIMPPPEFKSEVGQHFKQKERRVLAAMMMVARQRGQTLRDVLDVAMMPPRRMQEYLDEIEDSFLKQIIDGVRSAGDQAFAETMTGIITALRVFFNANVVRATSAGEPEDTVDLAECFRKPTLVVIGISPEDLMDGSGEVLFRLYKRRLDEALYKVAKEFGGKLPHHAMYVCDETPAIGRLPFMMRGTGTLRSYNASIHLGVQNDAQGRLVYEDDYWAAITENVMARKVFFVRGINGDDAKRTSVEIGMTTGVRRQTSSSTLTDVAARHTGSSSLDAVPLLAPEEFQSFSQGEAVVRVNGKQPIRVAFTPASMPFVTIDGARKVPNPLNLLYRDTVARIEDGSSLTDYTRRMWRAGTFSCKVTSTHLAPDLNASTQDSEARRDAIVALHTWVQTLIEEGATLRMDGHHRDIMHFAVATFGPRLAGLDLTPLEAHGFLARSDTAVDVKVTQRGLAQLTPPEVGAVRDLEVLGPLKVFLRNNTRATEGHPDREALPETERPEPTITLQDADVWIPVKYARELFGNVMPAGERQRQRLGTVRMERVRLPRLDAAALRAAVQAGRDEATRRAREASDALTQASGRRP